MAIHSKLNVNYLLRAAYGGVGDDYTHRMMKGREHGKGYGFRSSRRVYGIECIQLGNVWGAIKTMRDKMDASLVAARAEGWNVKYTTQSCSGWLTSGKEARRRRNLCYYDNTRKCRYTVAL